MASNPARPDLAASPTEPFGDPAADLNAVGIDLNRLRGNLARTPQEQIERNRLAVAFLLSNGVAATDMESITELLAMKREANGPKDRSHVTKLEARAALRATNPDSTG